MSSNQYRIDEQGRPTSHRKDRPVSEGQFGDAVIELAQLAGWRVVHFRPGRTAGGWRTPVQGAGKGFPDLVLVKGERLIFAELKSETGQVSAEQRGWLEDLGAVPGIGAEVWRPRDWPKIERLLLR